MVHIKKFQLKRSLFREQVSPHLGGKIPETAFNADRLILNRLQTDGIAVPDGIILEPRQYQVWPYEHRNTKQTYQVKIENGGHYIAMPLADTTYSVPTPLHYDIKWVPPFKPTYGFLEFPTHGKGKLCKCVNFVFFVYASFVFFHSYSCDKSP